MPVIILNENNPRIVKDYKLSKASKEIMTKSLVKFFEDLYIKMSDPNYKLNEKSKDNNVTTNKKK